VDIAAYGWEHPQWSGTFYPEDMPEDWRLDFYCNEFRAIVIPAQKWSEGDRSRMQEWASGLGEDTRVYLELPPDRPACGIREAITSLGGRVAGLVGRTPPALPRDIGAPVGIWGRQPGGAGSGIGWCWPEEGGIPRCTGEALASAWLDSGPTEPMHLRRIIEALAAGGREHRAVLVVDGRPPSLKLMRDACVLVDLLGL